MTDKMLVAQGVANHLFATEKAIDVAMAETAGLMASMVGAREELRVAAQTGDEAVTKVAEAMATLAQARQAVIAAHKDLNEVKLRVGIRTKMMGEYQKTASEIPAPLRSVA